MKRIFTEAFRLCILCGIVFSSLILTSCTSESEPKIEVVGSWIELGGTETMEFFADSTMLILDQGDTLKGNYQVIADSLIRFSVSGTKRALATPVEIKGKFFKDKIRFNKPDGSMSEYKKFK